MKKKFKIKVQTAKPNQKSCEFKRLNQVIFELLTVGLPENVSPVPWSSVKSSLSKRRFK